MKRFLIAGLCLTTLLSCGGDSGSTSTPVTTPDPVPTPPAEPVVTLPDEAAPYQLRSTEALLDELDTQLTNLTITEFFEKSYLAIYQRDPQRVISDGNASSMLSAEQWHLQDISDEYYFQTVAMQKLVMEKLLAYDKSTLSNADQVSWDAYHAYLHYQIQWSDHKKFEYPATYGIFGWPGSTQLFFTDLLPLTNKAEAEQYLAMVNQIPRRLAQIEQLLVNRSEAGVIEPVLTLGFSRNSVATVGNSESTATPYYQSFSIKVDAITALSAEEKVDLKNTLKALLEQRVQPAYQQLASKMLTLETIAPSDLGFGQFEGGEAFYDFALQFYTSDSRTVEEVHQRGLDELERIHAEMRTLFDQLGYPQDETLAELFARVDNDSGTIAGSQAVAFYEEIIAKAYTQLPETFSVMPEQEVTVIGGNFGGFYIRGSDDGTRPGAFYANNSSDLAYTRMPTLAYHEAIPGHHLQLALASEMNLPLFRRKEGFTSYIEGWGLYAERLASDLGWYADDPYGDLGRLQFEAMRAARLVLDTAIHVYGWDYGQADQFHIENVGYPGSIARYSVWPGQATAYTSGMLKILELRDKAQSELGDKYDIKDFHAEVIGNGAVPLGLLEQIIERYIARTKE